MSKLMSISLLTVAMSVLSGCGNVNNAWCPPEKPAEPAVKGVGSG